MVIHKTAVILVNWNSYALTRACLLSLLQIPATQRDVILVDNQSADGSGLQLQQEFPDIIYIQAEDNLGFTGGNNVAIRYAIDQGYQYILLLNNDTTVAANFLSLLTQHLEQHPATGAVQPLIYCHEPSDKIWNAGSFYNQWLGNPIVRKTLPGSQLQTNQAARVDWITGCAFMLRTEVLKQTGLLSEKMFMYFEDVDLSFRIRQAGYELELVPGAKIWHVGGMSNKREKKTKEGVVNPIVHYLNTRNKIWILKKYTPWFCLPTVLLFHLFYFSGILLYFLIRLRWNKWKAVLTAIRDGLSGNITYDHPIPR
ncbi:MAG: glycosyltransferase family 2 protein [Bacteroidota bacterium]